MKLFDSSTFFKLFLVAENQVASSSRSTIQETTLYPGRKSKSSLVVSPKWVSIQDNYESFAQDVTYSSRSSSFIILLLKWKTCFPLVSIILDRNLTCGQEWKFSPPRLTRPSPLRPARVFPAPQRRWSGDGARFQPYGAGMGLGFLDPPLPIPAPPRPTLLKVIIVNFSYPKTLLFKQTY